MLHFKVLAALMTSGGAPAMAKARASLLLDLCPVFSCSRLMAWGNFHRLLTFIHGYLIRRLTRDFMH